MVAGLETPRSVGRRVAIVGAGLAGVAAACELADRGFAVTLLERRPFAGGKTYSFAHTASGAEVDNGQHVILNCCTAYRDFLRRLGQSEAVRHQRRLDVVIMSMGRPAHLAARPWPAPFHLLPSLLGYQHLSPRERLRAVWGALHMLRTDERTPGLDDQPFAAWLRRHGQTPELIQRLWDVIVVATLNGRCEEVSAAAALMVLRTGFLRSTTGGGIGVPSVPLSALHVEPALCYLQQRGAEFLTRAAVRSVHVEDGAVVGLSLADGASIEASACVLATPPSATLKLLPHPWRDHPFFDPIGRIRSAPIVNVHLWYERPVIDLPFVAFVDDDLQWAFNTSLLHGERLPGQHLTLSLSAAQRYMSLEKREIIERLASALGRIFPAARGNRLVQAVVIKEPDATFLPEPGAGRRRPGPATPIAGLFLAGAWTDTGWPATMESAVRSGMACAQAVGERLSAAGPPIRVAAAAV